MSQSLPLSPPFPLLDSRPPVQRERPTDGGERSAQRQAFGRMLDRFAQSDRGPDAPKDSPPAPQDQRPREHRVDSDDSSGAPQDDTTSDSDTDTTDASAAAALPAHAAPAPSDPAKPVPDAAQAPAIAAATPAAVAVVVPVVAAAPTAAAPTTAPTIAAIPAAVAAPAASKEPEPVAGTPAAAVSKIAAVPAEAVAAAAVQEAAPGTFAFDPVTMPAPRPRQVAAAANGRTEPAGKATAAVPADKAAAELAAPQAGRFQTARAEADATVAANSNQAQAQFRIVKADANAAAADAPTLAGARDDRAATQGGADQAVAGLTALDSPRQTAALYHKVADAAKAGADAPTPADQVSIRLVHAVAEGKRAIQMHLHPAELGSIDVKMQWQGDKLTAQFTVDRPETLQILQREVPALERSLGQAGVNVDSGSLSFSLRQQQGNGKGNGEGFNQAAANAGLGDGGEPGAGDAPLGQVIRDGILSIRV